MEPASVGHEDAERRVSLTNNFFFDFALRRQSLLSLNRVFGMGETGLTTTGISKGDGQNKEQESALERRKSSPRSFGSPPHTAGSSAKSGHSLFKMAGEKRARKVRFYRNGDRFFKGMVYAVSTERFRTLEGLLNTLTSSALCDSKTMPNGVRHIFTVDGTHRIVSLDQLQEGESYVCASTDVFRALDYCKNEEANWNVHMVPQSFREHMAQVQRELQQHKDKTLGDDQSQGSDENSLSAVTERQTRPHSSRSGKQRVERSKSSKSEMSTSQQKAYDEYQRSFVIPRLITVIKSGKRPRKAVRLLLNKKTAQSFDQVMADITDAVKLDCGRVKKVFALSGRQVTCLSDFFQEDTIFLACGHEKIGLEELVLDRRELRQVSAYRPFTGKARERVTLRNSSNTSSISKSSDRHSTVVSPGSDQSTQRSETGEQVKSLPSEEKVPSKFDISQVPMPITLTNKYEVGSLIGTGNFAVVLECKDKRSNRKYALKIINKEFCKGKEKLLDNEVGILRCARHPNIIRLVEDYTYQHQIFLVMELVKEKMIDNEVRILRSLRHPNIIRLVEDYSNQHQIFYIMELVKGGDLFDAIASSSSKYTEQDASGMLYNLASALEYLHSLHIVHRDVKPENILIRQHDDGTKSLKLGDFGLATEVKGPLYTVCGTPTYVAPEVIAETGYGEKIDVWSAGVIAYILLCGFPPFSSPNDNQDELFDMIMTGNYDFPSPYWDDVTDSAKDVISGMLEIDPETRLSASRVLEHPWVASDTQYDADLRKKVSSGLSTYFRRGPKTSPKYAGIRVIATTALDKASRFFQGRGAPYDRSRGKEE